VVILERSPIFSAGSKKAVDLSQARSFSKGELSVGALLCVLKIIKIYRKCVKEIIHNSFFQDLSIAISYNRVSAFGACISISATRLSQKSEFNNPNTTSCANSTH